MCPLRKRTEREALSAIILILVFGVVFIFLSRWRVRLFNELRDWLHRIADAIESIAQRR